MTAKRALTMRPLPLSTLSTAVNMQVVDAASSNATERCERPGVRIEQHLVAPAGIGHQPERAARAQLHVGHPQPVVDAADDQPLFAPVELERLAEFERQRHEGVGRYGLAFAQAPRTNEVGDAAVAALVAGRLDLDVQRTRRAPLVLRAVRVGLQRQLERLVVRRKLRRPLTPPVLRLDLHRRLKPLAHRVARHTRAPGNVAVREMVAVVHPPDLANHVHGDHLQTLLKFAADQSSTLVSFESALARLHGQFSVGVNTAVVHQGGLA